MGLKRKVLQDSGPSKNAKTSALDAMLGGEEDSESESGSEETEESE